VTEAGRVTLRVFISSPSDVRPERLIAERVVRRLDREFEHHLRVEVVMWEHEPLLASHHFQEKITPPHAADIVVVILWSRLGLPLPGDKFLGPLSQKEVTGTEWEFEDALKSHREHSRPDLLMYRKKVEVTISLNDRSAVRARQQQWDQVEDFFQTWFVDAKGALPSAASWSFDDPVTFEEMLATHLRELIRRHVDRASTAADHPTAHYFGNPFRGLLSFELEHAAVFFGRSHARNELRELLARQAERGCAFVLVFGASGSGKSSLVKAGLLADLVLPGMIGRVALVRYAVLRPSDRGGALLEALAAAIIEPPAALPELAAPPFGDTVETFAALLRDAPAQASRPIRQALATAGQAAGLGEAGEARLLVIIDQLEELFTQDQLPERERDAFVAALDALAKSGVVWIVTTMRSDFFDRLETLPTLAALSTGEARFLLMPPDNAEVGQIIRQPAREAGLRFELDPDHGQGLDEVIQQATASQQGALPLLSFLLDQLWQRCSETGLLTLAAYRELGGLEGAIGRRAEQVFLAQPADVQNEGVALLRSLVTVRDGKATSRPAPVALFPAGSARRALVDAFLHAEARLLVADNDSGGARLRLTHEALLTHWPRARDQIAADTRDLELRGRLELEAEAWRAAPPRDKPGRLRGPGLPLAEALALAARWGAQLPAAVIDFVVASRRAARRRRLRLVGTLAGAVLALPVIALVTLVALVWWGVRSVEAELEFVAIPAGCFDMGSPDTEVERSPNERQMPGLCVKAFDLSKYEVTQGQFERVTLHNPSLFRGDIRRPDRIDPADDRRPVESVSWHDAQWFISWMSLFGRRSYRLPTSIEWEYAARAGTATARYWGDRAEDGCSYENVADQTLKKGNPDLFQSQIANCEDGYDIVAPVGSFKPNPFGLHDMLGNVSEWIEDCYHPDIPSDGSQDTDENCPARGVRGGSWSHGPQASRSAYRGSNGGNRVYNSIGFRLARTIAP
jgi:formylglycine-generating enzyme required for sulfatase activity